MQPSNGAPPGLFEIIVAGATYVLGVQIAQLVAPSLAVMFGWMCGLVGAIYLRDAARKPVPFAVFTFGAALAISTPAAAWLAPMLEQGATALLVPIGIAVPFAGDWFLSLVARLLPAKLQAILGVEPQP